MEKQSLPNLMRNSKIKPPSISSKNLAIVYEKTRLLRTVLEREITRRVEDPIQRGFSSVAGHSRILPEVPLEVRKKLNFTGLDESKKDTNVSLGILQSEDLDNFQHSSPNTTQRSENISDGILNASQMRYGSFEDKSANLNADYLLKRLQDQLVLHNTLVDASEKFPKSPSVENLVKQCVKGTKALEDLKQRVARYKTLKRTMNVSLAEVPRIIRSAIECTDELNELSEQIMQFSGGSNSDLFNRSSLTNQAIKDASLRLKEIERQWANVPFPEEDDASLGLVHESEMHSTDSFLQNVSKPLDDVFESVNQSIEEVLKTPNTASLSALKTKLKDCHSFLHTLTSDQSQLIDETLPSFAEPFEESELSLLTKVTDELNRSYKSEVEAFLEIMKSPEKERFFHISKQTINNLSILRDEANEMLQRLDSSNKEQKREQLVKRFENLRAAAKECSGEQKRDQLTNLRDTASKGFTSILLKDYLDEDDFFAETKSSNKSYATVGKRTVQFSEHSNSEADHARPIETRLELFLTELYDFQEKVLHSNTMQNDHEGMKIIEKKLDNLMEQISVLVKILRSKEESTQENIY
ncbi:uncharacterized protein LOC131285010 [Anopheles ziemanni]|uniref:uncharacterized protein LOC131262913 n=1 Tax=Anopheles coustani TaxID=139045 RepID=UPI002658EF54|nr:uncharacterized protein LOC131262913 [Anopheles coustani]XP_058169853.1 uncharacterized protein LOC131285010 [Anopheles ziemanni]